MELRASLLFVLSKFYPDLGTGTSYFCYLNEPNNSTYFD